MARKKRAAPKTKTIPAWPLGFAPPGPPTRVIVELPPELDDIPVTTLTELDEIIEVAGWEEDE